MFMKFITALSGPLDLYFFFLRSSFDGMKEELFFLNVNFIATLDAERYSADKRVTCSPRKKKKKKTF